MFAVWQVYIATPAYGGQVTVDYMTSVIHMVTQLKEATQLMIAVGANSAVPVGSGCVAAVSGGRPVSA